MKTISRSIWIGTAVSFLVGVLLVGWVGLWLAGEPMPLLPDRLHGMVLPAPQPVTDFTLQGLAQMVSLYQLRGSIVLITFGYLNCPDVCPANLSVMRQAYQTLPAADQAKTKLVFVSVDPERDTPEKVQAHVSRFESHFLGLTGTHEALAAATVPLGVYYERELNTAAPNGYWVNHTASIMLIDGNGQLRIVYPFSTSHSDIEHDIRSLLH